MIFIPDNHYCTRELTFWTKTILLSFLLLNVSRIAAQESDTYEKLRHKMVKQQIEARGVSDENVLRVIRIIPRHLFVPVEFRPAAYSDRSLPIGLEQTISQPFIVAYMTELLKPAKHHKVLEIGTGSGYQAAVLAELVGHVYTIEIIPELGNQAAARLDSMGYDNVTVKIGDGYQGWPEEAPFDRIIVTAAPEEIPQKLVEQLKPGGLMVIPTGPKYWGQDLIVLEKSEDGSVTSRKTIPVRFVPMVHD